MEDHPQGASHAIPEIMPKAGLVYSEKGNLTEVLCKPKIMPIKSMTLERIEQLERQAAEMGNEEVKEEY